MAKRGRKPGQRKRTWSQVLQVREVLTEELGRPPSHAEVAAELDIATVTYWRMRLENEGISEESLLKFRRTRRDQSGLG